MTLTPERPQVGRPYFRVSCRVDSLNLLRVAEEGSNSLQWWRRRESNPKSGVGETPIETGVLAFNPPIPPAKFVPANPRPDSRILPDLTG